MKAPIFVIFILSACIHFGIALPQVNKPAEFCFNYPHTIAGDYVTKRDLTTSSSPDIQARKIDSEEARSHDLHTRSIPFNVPWCSPASTIYIKPFGLSFVGGIAKSVIQGMVVEALNSVTEYMQEYGNQLLPVRSWNFISGQDPRYTIHVHGDTTFLVLREGLRSLLDYLTQYDCWGTLTFNVFDHVGIDVAQGKIKFTPDADADPWY